MRIGVIGIGVVGGAISFGFEKLGHRVLKWDTKKEKRSLDVDRIDDLYDTDIIYLCLPTPSLETGSCDAILVEHYVRMLNSDNYKGVVAVKSTVEPGTTANLSLGRPNLLLCFVPEFLRERSAVVDFIENHNLLAIGCDVTDVNRHSKIIETVIESHGKYPKNTAAYLSTTQAELLKYYSNIFNAVKITFANEMYELCKALGQDYAPIKEAFILRETATDMYLDVNDNWRGFAGACLPKDLAAIVQLVDKRKLDLNLFKVVQEENDKFKKTVPEGMRE